jgi:hypothetical protein
MEAGQRTERPFYGVSTLAKLSIDATVSRMVVGFPMRSTSLLSKYSRQVPQETERRY